MWYENDKQKAGGVDPTLDLSPGIHVLTFVVMDDRGQTGQDSLTVFVINKAESVAPTQNETTADVFDAVAI
jgi:hypothetical protein